MFGLDQSVHFGSQLTTKKVMCIVLKTKSEKKKKILAEISMYYFVTAKLK